MWLFLISSAFDAIPREKLLGGGGMKDLPVEKQVLYCSRLFNISFKTSMGPDGEPFDTIRTTKDTSSMDISWPNAF